MGESKQENFRRRLTDKLALDECGAGQRILYDFLTEMDSVMGRLERLEIRVGGIEEKILERLDALEEEQKPIRVIKWAWEKFKTSGLALVIIAYTFRDHPHIEAILKALL